MTPDQYRREGAEAMRKAAIKRVEWSYTNTDETGPLLFANEAIRAIDVDEVVGVRSVGVYIASKTKYASEWLAMRENGYPIISTWIDEAGEGETSDWPDLWSRCVSEASSAKALVVISRDGDTLKGAWVEVGAALGAGKTVFAAGCHSFTIRHHPRFVICASEAEAFARAALAAMETSHD